MPTPAELGYRWPAEWEPHAATWLAWPRNRETWPGTFDAIPPVWKKLVETLSAAEPVHILAGGEDVMQQAQEMVGGLENVHLHDIPTNDAWIRDHGPTFLARADDAPRVLLDWKYNAWGGKYPPYDLDNDVPRRIAQLTGCRRYEPGIVLEGGSVDSNGRGTLLTTEECLLNPNRNAGQTRDAIEHCLRDFFAVDNVIWLGRGLSGDDTDGHVDELARFVSPRTVVAVVEEDRNDPNFEPLQENLRRLLQATDQDGNALEVIPLPMPRPRYNAGQRLPASYANFYIANSIVIIPQFGDDQDEKVAELFSGLFPDRAIHALAAGDLISGLGGFHCVTQQEPMS